MASPRARRLRNALLALLLLGGGLWLAGSALWQLGRTAVFVHESVVVTGTVIDVRQKPFENWSDTLGKGNWSWPGDTSYQPIVRFTLPGDIDAIRLDLAADNEDYHTGQAISIISPPGQPGRALINRGKFLWGASCLRLGVGAVLSLIGYAMWRRLRGKRATPPAPAKRPARQPAPIPAKASRPRKRAESTNSSPAPRKRRKAEGNAPGSKPRRSRKKAAAEQSPELPF